MEIIKNRNVQIFAAAIIIYRILLKLKFVK